VRAHDLVVEYNLLNLVFLAVDAGDPSEASSGFIVFLPSVVEFGALRNQQADGDDDEDGPEKVGQVDRQPVPRVVEEYGFVSSNEAVDGVESSLNRVLVFVGYKFVHVVRRDAHPTSGEEPD